MKISNPDDFYEEKDSNVKYGKRSLEDLNLRQIGKYDSNLEKKLRDDAFEKSKNNDGEYQCAICKVTGKDRVFFQVDHIIPMNKGGKSVAENLQILCRQCNGKKGDR